MFGSAAHRAYGRLISDGKIVMVVQCRGVADALRLSSVQKGVFPTGLARYTTSAVGAIRRGGGAPLRCHGHDEGQQRRFCLGTPGRANIVLKYTSDLLIAGVRFRLAGCLSCLWPAAHNVRNIHVVRDCLHDTLLQLAAGASCPPILCAIGYKTIQARQRGRA